MTLESGEFALIGRCVGELTVDSRTEMVNCLNSGVRKGIYFAVLRGSRRVFRLCPTRPRSIRNDRTDSLTALLNNSKNPRKTEGVGRLRLAERRKCS